MRSITAERSHPDSRSDHPIYSRHLFAYEQTAPKVQGDVLEVGCGEGYGLRLLAPLADSYTAIDPYRPDDRLLPESVTFVQSRVPPFPELKHAPFDVILTHQVIEHIESDRLFVSELRDLLKPGGVLVLSTPNKPMSLTRNPWHVREYNARELRGLIHSCFDKVEMLGIFGKEIVREYHDRNRLAVQKWKKLDFLKLEYRLPRRFLQIPYDILNRINRLSLQRNNESLVDSITSEDFYLAPITDEAFDHFCIATRTS